MYCRNCGKEMSEGDKVCRNCGFITDEARAPKAEIRVEADPEFIRSKSKNRTVAMILSILVTGLGQIYMRKYIKGIGLIALQIILMVFLWLVVVYSGGALMAYGAIVGSIQILTWAYGIVDTFMLHKEYNAILTETGQPPW